LICQLITEKRQTKEKQRKLEKLKRMAEQLDHDDGAGIAASASMQTLGEQQQPG
jgi:hypothetical protein